MEKECCQVKFIEIDEGYRIEITGKELKEHCSCLEILKQCCSTSKSNCC